jgi:hypothetical protein
VRTRSTGRGHEVVVIPPERCAGGGKPLEWPNTQVFVPGGGGETLWRCWACGTVTRQDGGEWIDPKAGHGSGYG